jgi:hypothetical protein
MHLFHSDCTLNLNIEQQQKDHAVAATFQFKKGDRCQVCAFIVFTFLIFKAYTVLYF